MPRLISSYRRLENKKITFHVDIWRAWSILTLLRWSNIFIWDRYIWCLRRSELFTETRQEPPLNCAPEAKSAILDYLVMFVNFSHNFVKY